MKGRRTTVTILMADDDDDDCMLAREALAESRLANDLYIVQDGEELLGLDVVLVRLITSPCRLRSIAGSGWVAGIRPSVSATR